MFCSRLDLLVTLLQLHVYQQTNTEPSFTVIDNITYLFSLLLHFYPSVREQLIQAKLPDLLYHIIFENLNSPIEEKALSCYLMLVEDPLPGASSLLYPCLNLLRDPDEQEATFQWVMKVLKQTPSLCTAEYLFQFISTLMRSSSTGRLQPNQLRAFAELLPLLQPSASFDLIFAVMEFPIALLPLIADYMTCELADLVVYYHALSLLICSYPVCRVAVLQQQEGMSVDSLTSAIMRHHFNCAEIIQDGLRIVLGPPCSEALELVPKIQEFYTTNEEVMSLVEKLNQPDTSMTVDKILERVTQGRLFGSEGMSRELHG